MTMIQAYLALGSNLQDPAYQVKSALMEIADIPDTTLLNASRLYQNPPVGKIDQPDFINAVAEVETSLSAPDLLHYLLEIEQLHFRVRTEKNGPRTLDLDLLLYGNQTLDLPFLRIPHPRLKERVFVIIPLAEIAPNLILPCGTAIEKLIPSYSNHMLKVCSAINGE